MTDRALLFTALAALALTAAGAAGGWVAGLAGLPLPWLIGSLAASALIVGLGGHRLPAGFRYPEPLRLSFIAVIGLMIGAQVTPDLATRLPGLAVSLAALAVFTLAAFAASYAVFRGLGGYDRVTAFYCATPGGLYESIMLGEAAGADIRQLTLQQFLRIILVVTLLPLGITLIEGMPVGSSAGVTGAPPGAEVTPWGLASTLAAGAVGLIAARRLRLPAGQLLGPLLAAAALNLTGFGPVALPAELVIAAQIVVGASLGARFLGVTGRMLGRAAGLGLVSVGVMLAMAGGAAMALSGVTGKPVDVLLISFAPGGVTEMSLVALSLGASPAIVTLHHLFRIGLTVVIISVASKLKIPR
ncbi:AbrB family transcriptional regulator [Rhodosalinus halophilus]|uniref:AbrB family transcriptional regulator n=1 Tax=Rhodosalinus halophilus TaxID=2259333 RepID=A0A365U823_9RHOB|nr:AbrB family transcriptional regulator [Rhodosalinus halophilus]RBI84063.1 AbrB family transcriptional regulator [Rhodosalinus halophilus]